MTYRFSVRRDFDLGASVMCGQVFRWHRIDPSHLAGTVGAHACFVREKGDSYEITSNCDEESFIRLFRLDFDWTALISQIRDAGIDATDTWVRTMRSPSPVETLFSFMCTANNNIARIQPMVQVLGRSGTAIWEHQGITFHQFPTVEQIAAITEESLRQCGFGYRARQVPAAAQLLCHFGAAEFLESLKDIPHHVATAELCQLPGVGQKVADCTALHGLDHTSTVPVDTHIWQFAVQQWFPEWRGQSLTNARYLAVADRFRELFGDAAGLAQQLVFHRSLQAKKAQ